MNFSALLLSFCHKKQENFQAQRRSPPLRAIGTHCLSRDYRPQGRAPTAIIIGLRVKPALEQYC